MGKGDIISVEPISKSNDDNLYQHATEEENTKSISYDIAYSMKPLHSILRVFGMSRMPYLSDCTKKIHFLIMLCALLCALICTVNLRLRYVYPKMTKIVEIMDMVDLFTLSSMAICNLFITGIKSPYIYMSIYKNFSVIDELINIDVSKKYRKGRKVVLKVIFFIIAPLIVISARLNGLIYSSASFLSYALYFLNCLVTTQFIISMYSVRSHFYTINCQLRCYIEKHKNSIMDSSKLSEESTFIEVHLFSFGHLKKISCEGIRGVKFNVQKLTNVYLLNCDICDLFNSYYSIQVSFSILYNINLIF